MEIELLIKADFHSFKSEIVDEIKRLFQLSTEQQDLMKSADVMKVLVVRLVLCKITG